MTEFVRLLDGAATETERALLESARVDGPSLELRRQTVVALGLASGALAVGSSVAKGATAAPAGAALKVGALAGAVANSGAPITALGLVKWLAAGTAAGVLGIGAISTVLKATDEERPRKAVVTVESVARGAPKANYAVPPAAVFEPSEVSSSAEKEIARPEAHPAPRRPRVVERTAPEEVVPMEEPAYDDSSEYEFARRSVLDEVASLDTARRGLAAGQAERAVALLLQHEQQYPNGTLAPEARVLRIRALLRAGRGEEAERLGKQFLRRYPKSPHARRIRALLKAR